MSVETKTPALHHVEDAHDGGLTHVLETDGETAQVVHADGTVDIIDAHALGGEVDVMPPGYFRSPQFIGTVVAQCLASIAAYLGWVLPANTLALINADIGNSIHVGWAATIWTMGSSIGFLLVGRLSDLYGRKGMVLGTGVLSLIGCILGATCKNVAMLIVAMGCNGIGAAGQLSFGIILGELVPNNKRGPIITVVFLSSLPFAVFGPIIARTMIENIHEGWRWSFYIGIMINGLSIVMYYFLYHPPTFSQLHVGKTVLQQTKELDWTGIFIFIAGCVLFLIGLSWGGVTYPWQSPEVLATLIVGIALVAGFFVYEGFFCRVQPLMPPRMFKNIRFVAVITTASIGSMVYYSFTVLWPTMLTTVYRASVTEVGWQSSVVGGGMLLGQTMGGLGISYVPRVKIQAIIAGTIAFAFTTSLISISEERWAFTIAFSVVAIAAIGYIENVTFSGVTLLWEPQDIGLATGILGCIRGLSGAVAQSLYSAIYSNKLTTYMPEYVTAAATGAGLPEDSLTALFAGITAGDFSAVPGMNSGVMAAVSQALVSANRESFKYVFYATIPFSAILLGAAFLIPNMEKYLTKNVAKRLQDTQFRREVNTEKQMA